LIHIFLIDQPKLPPAVRHQLGLGIKTLSSSKETEKIPSGESFFVFV
jgi:hypothetical protein